MTIDARALITLIRKAPGYEDIVTALADDPNPRVCATALAEAAILLGGADEPMVRLDIVGAVRHLNLTVVPFTEGDWREAVEAYGLLKKAGGEPRPTLGYCLSAAVAVKTGAKMMPR